METLELRNQLQTLWRDLQDNPGNRALVVATTAAHHGDEKIRRLFARLIERQTPESDERDQALKLLAEPPAPPVVAHKEPDPPPETATPTEPPDKLMTLWYDLGGNPRYRAQVISGIVNRLKDKELTRKFSDLITHQTPPSLEKSRALALLNPRPISHIHIVPDPPEERRSYLLTDPELGRLCIALDWASQYRLWVIIRHLTRNEEGSGIISKNALQQALTDFDIHYTPRHFDRLLQNGEGLFWTINRKYKRIYLHSWINLGLNMARKADAAGMDMSGNKPGARQSYTNVSGSLEHWEASIYAGWLCLHEGVTIARETLSMLFRREANTIRRWEVQLGREFQKRFNFVQCSDPERYFKHIPAHSIPYATRIYHKGRVRSFIRVRWQIPNTYSTRTFNSMHKGQGRKVRRAINAEYPPDLKPGGQCLRYLKSPKHLKTLHHNLKFRMGLRGDVYRPFYVLLGENYRTKHGIFEITSTGFCFTHRNERVGVWDENAILKELGRLRRVALREEMKKNETLISPT